MTHNHEINRPESVAECLTCELNVPGALGAYERPLAEPITWPGGARIAVSVVYNYQGAEGLLPNDKGYIDYETWSEREYGPKVGIWRCLRVMKEAGVRGTFLVCGATAEHYPDSVEAILADGHEVAGHGYHHERAIDQTRPDEEAVVHATTEILEKITGERITGWRNCHQSRSTAQICMDMGFRYNSNSFHQDVPYILEHEGRTLVEIPRQPFGDMRTYGRVGFGGPEQDAYDIWRAMFDTFYEESETAATYVPLSLHPFITGRPGRSEALARLLRHVQGHDGVWLATQDEIAAHVETLAIP